MWYWYPTDSARCISEILWKGPLVPVLQLCFLGLRYEPSNGLIFPIAIIVTSSLQCTLTIAAVTLQQEYRAVIAESSSLKEEITRQLETISVMQTKAASDQSLMDELKLQVLFTWKWYSIIWNYVSLP